MDLANPTFDRVSRPRFGRRSTWRDLSFAVIVSTLSGFQHVSTCLAISPDRNEESGRLGQPLAHDEQHRNTDRRQLALIDVNTGEWMEFESDAVVGSFAYGCDPVGSYCSNSTSSQALGSTNNNPWNFTSASCTQLTVMEGYTSGEAVYEVLDNGVSLGSTSLGLQGTDCQADPTMCWIDVKVGKGQWILSPGTHSIQIKVSYQIWYGDGGWIQLQSVSCPTQTTPTRQPTRKPTSKPTKKPTSKPTKSPTRNPTNRPVVTTKSPTRKPTRNPTKKPTSAPVVQLPTCLKSTSPCEVGSSTICCSGLVCRRSSFPSGAYKCKTCQQNTYRCEINGDCCSGLCATSTTNPKIKVCKKNQKK